MNAISKRLFSWLIVAAMVLSMAPVIDLAGFAVESQAAEIEYGSANFDGVDQAILDQMAFGNGIDNSDANIDAHIAAGTCPMCNATGITWEKKTAGFTFNDKEGETAHIYFDSEFTTPNNLLQMVNYPADNDLDSKDGTLCVALKSTANITCSKYRIQMGGTNNVLNIMGTGKITADQSQSEWNQGDLGLFQVGSSTVNLYGGEFRHVHKGDDFRKAVIRITGASAVVNIFDGVKIGPETQDDTKVAMNVAFEKGGTVNMFGGEIRNGVSPAWGYGANVTIAQNGKFNMYGGTIKNGTFLSAVTAGTTSNATIGGNIMVGGKHDASFYVDGVENYSCSAGTFAMYGGTVSGGKANNGGNGGGNINIYGGASSATIMGGTVEGGYAKASGGNIQVCGGDLTIGGTALITGGEALIDGGNIQLNNTNSALTISGGKITAGKGKNGGNIYVNKTEGVTISGGVIEDGTAASSGGNLALGADASDKAVISGGVFQNGLAERYGGNVETAANLTIDGGEFLNGTCRLGGGNINVSKIGANLTVNGGTLANGWVTGAWNEDAQNYKPTGANWGGNIRIWASNLVINGGLVYGGARGPEKSAHQSNNIGCLASIEKTATADLAGANLTIAGGIIVGDIGTSPATSNEGGTASCPGTAVTLKGAPKILTSYELADGTTVSASQGALSLGSNASGSVKANIDELTADAQIVVSAPEGRVLTAASANAAAVAACFSTPDETMTVAVNDQNELYVTEIPFEFVPPVKPEVTLGGQNVSDENWENVVKAAEIQAKAARFELGADNMAECPVCGEVVEWKEATRPGQTGNDVRSRHYYIDADTQVTKNYNWFTVAGGRVDGVMVEADGVNVCLMLLNGDTAKEIGGIMGLRNSTKNCTFNIMGDGVITSDGTSTSDAQFGVVLAQGASNTVNLYGGTFIYTGDGEGRKTVDENGDGEADKDENGKTIYVPNGTVAAAAINIKGSENTLNMYNDVVVGPETQDLTKVNYNVRIDVNVAKATNTFNMYGGIIRNGVTNNSKNGGNVHMAYASKYIQTKPTLNMYGGTIENGTYMQGEGITSVTANGGNIYAGQGTQLNVYGGAISGGKVNGTGGNIAAIDSSITRINLYGGTIKDGQAKHGGNIYATAKIELNEYALIEGGYATNNGGNIYITGSGKVVTQKTGSEVRNGTCGGTGGGNVFVNVGATYNMEGGKVYDGENLNASSNANAGNILVQGLYKEGVFTDAYLNMSGDAEIYGGIAPNQAGNVRGYIATVTMTDNAKIYGGDGVKGTDDLWLVDGNLVMDGNATVESTVGTDAISATVYRRNNTITLKGNASVLGEYDALSISKGLHADDKVTPLAVTLQIDNGWTGTANVNFKEYYAPGATLLEEDAICGSEVDGVFTKGGSFAGKLAYGRLGYCALTGVDGALVLASNGVVKADGTGEWFATAAEALAAYEHGVDQYVVISEDATINGDVVIDLAGQNITLSGNGKVYGMDSQNDSYAAFGAITIAEGAQITFADSVYHPITECRYIALLEGAQLSFHRISMTLNAVTLRTDVAGLKYKATYTCDEVLAAKVTAYGTVLSLNDMPGVDFLGDTDDINMATQHDGPIVLDENGKMIVESDSVVGILKAERTALENQEIGEMLIYANVYLMVGDKVFVGKGENPYADPEDNIVAYSLKDVLIAIDDIWASYTEENKATVKAFYETWKDLGVSAWASELENIIAYEPAPEEAPVQ